MRVETVAAQVPIWSFSSYAALEVQDIVSVAPAADEGGTATGFIRVSVPLSVGVGVGVGVGVCACIRSGHTTTGDVCEV